MKTPNGYTKQNVDVYATPDGRFVVVGQPARGDDGDELLSHSCDAMGCGQEHVLYRGQCDEFRTKEQP